MIKLGVSFKVTLGYVLLVFVLCFAAWLIYGNTNSYIEINKAEENFMRRRGIADSLVYCILDINNHERALSLGIYGELDEFDRSVNKAVRLADTFKSQVGDSVQKEKIETLRTLLLRKRDNTIKILMSTIAMGNTDIFFKNKVDSLHGGKDSVIVHPQALEIKEDKEVVYEVVKRKKSFLSRLADAFKGSRNDTVSVRQNKSSVVDSSKRNINIADTVANLLTNIKQEQDKQRKSKFSELKQREKSQRRVGVLLARRIEQILKDIRVEEYKSLQTALNNDIEARRSIMGKIVFLACVSVFSAIILMLYVSRDIRRDKRYRQSLESAKEETEKLLGQRERLLLTITHDIKAPAASISGFIELLGEIVDGSKAKTYLNNIRSSATHLQHLVSALLDYHQLEKGKVEIRLISFSAAQLVESCVEELRPQAEAKGLQLMSDTDKCRDRMCRSDAFRIRQILENLISNAVKYTSEGYINVSASVADGLLRISVADTGQGMSPDECRRVFDAFTRLPGAQGEEGVGLGLSITRELVTLLNGTVKLDSKKDEGTTFHVTLPVVVTGTSDDTHSSEDTANIENNSLSHIIASHKILIIDDDDLQLKLLQEMLLRISKQWEIRTCRHVKEGLEELRTGHFTILITDIEMPEMNGFEMIKKIDHSHIFVLAMTAHEKSIEPDLKEAGFDACLFKPFKIRQLAETICTVTGDELESKEKSENRDEEKQADYGRFSGITAFAADDKDATQEILSSFEHELSGYLDGLCAAIKTIDRNKIANLAHKSLPLLDMVKAECVEVLKYLSPEHINELDDATVVSYCRQVATDIQDIKNQLVSYIKKVS